MLREDILVYKLTKPETLSNLVARHGLLHGFDAEPFNRLTLVCAPVGYGKTTLVSSWAHAGKFPVAWLSLDQGDNDPVRFLAGLVATIQLHSQKFGEEMLRVLQSSNPPPIAALETKFINELSALSEKLVLVLDDYHLIQQSTIHGFVVFLLDHQPKNVQIVIISRSEPPFSLARLRTHGRLTELNETSLRFTVSESEDYLNRMMNLDLSSAQIETLRDRTEGWVACLQLAAISLRGNRDGTAFIESFSGVERHVTDFLMDEVLSNLSEQMQTFLLQTSIVERFNPALCDAITARNDSLAMLAELERAHMFLVPLDATRTWYRYHHLFVELLQNRMMVVTSAEQLNELHLRAARWHMENKFPTEAITHAVAAKDTVLAARVIEQYGMWYLSHGKIRTISTWMQHIPQAIIMQYPSVALFAAFSAYARPRPDIAMAEEYLKAVDKLLLAKPKGARTTEDDLMLGRLAVMRGYQARFADDSEKALTLFNKACTLLPRSDLFFTIARTNVAIFYTVLGRHEEAIVIFEEYAVITKDQSHLWFTAISFFGLSHIQNVRGNLLAARKVCESGLQQFAAIGLQDLPVCCMFHLGFFEYAYQTNDIKEAKIHATRAFEMAKAGGLEFFVGSSQIFLALVDVVQGEKSSLSPLLEQQLLNIWGPASTALPSTSGYMAKLWLAQGRGKEFSTWIVRRGISTMVLRDEMEMDYLMIARLQLQRRHLDEALDLLSRLLVNAERGGRTGSMIESLVLLALVRQAQSNTQGAISTLRQALQLARESGYVRLFVDEGLPMRHLLQKTDVASDLLEYRDMLIAAFPQSYIKAVSNFGPLIPLSAKEVKVAKLIGIGLSNEEIAGKLFVSPHTVKCHLKSIYHKFGVSKRYDAIQRIRELGLQ